MPNARRESKGSVYVYSPRSAFGRAILCWLERFCLKDSRLVLPHRCDPFQLVIAGFIFWTAWLNVSGWVSSWVSSKR